MPREGSFHCTCWEVGIPPGDVEGVLTKMREESPSLIIQVFSASDAPNPTALGMVAAQTLSAARSGSTLAERPELDLLLRLAGTGQIGEAFQRVGYKSGGKRLFMVAASEGDGAALRRLGEGLGADGRFVKIAKRELAKGELDMVERAALLAAKL